MLLSEALEGKYYRSRSFARKGKEGIIQWAERRDNVSTSENEYAYIVKVRPTWNGQGFPKPDFYATVYVEVN
jgi:hypothetical protein